MKNRKSIYILLPIVLLIWGIVIYRFFSYSAPEIPEQQVSNNFRIDPLTIKVQDTFSIDVNYRDPFLGKMYIPNEQAKKINIPKKQKSIEPFVWPDIIYKGIVSDSKEKNKVFMVAINGQTYLLEEKGVEQGVTLLKGNRQSIEVTYKGRKNQIMLRE